MVISFFEVLLEELQRTRNAPQKFVKLNVAREAVEVGAGLSLAGLTVGSPKTASKSRERMG